MTWKNETTRQPLPAPLPMYEPVRLKHVPTYVKRRYDRDINKVDDANKGSSSIDIKDEVDGPEEATLIDYVDATVKSEVVVQDNEHGVQVGSHEQDIKIVDDGTNKDGIVASWYENGSVQDEVLGDEHGNFDKEQGLPEEGDRSKGDGAQDVIHDAAGPELDDSVDYEAEDDDAQENSDTNSLEETKCEGKIQHKDGASSVEASVVEDSIKDHGHENSDIYDQDFEEEEDGANDDVNMAYVDTSVNNGDHSDQHNEKDLRAEDCKRFEDGTKDVTVASNYMDETVKLEEITEKQHENLDIKQGIYQAQPSSLASTPWLARRLIQVQWDPSPTNFHKFNFDGLSISSPRVGIIIRDSHGVILSAQVYKMGPISPVVAEAWALRIGILQANKLGRSNLCTESDTRSHIRIIFCDYQRPWILQFLVEDSKHVHSELVQ